MSNDRSGAQPPGTPGTSSPSAGANTSFSGIFNAKPLPPLEAAAAAPPPTPARPAPPAAPAAAAAQPPPEEGAGSGDTLLGGMQGTKARIDLAATALRLRDEQILAKVIYFGAEQQTNAELDAITAAVIADLKNLQLAGLKAINTDHRQVEIELTGALRGLLEKLLSNKRAGFMQRKLEAIQRRITTLFFNSALFTKISAGQTDTLTMTWPDQAVYYVLRVHREALEATLASLTYADEEVREEAKAKLDSIEKGLRMEYLSRTTPELEKLLEIFREVLLAYFFGEFKTSLGEFCWEVIRESRIAEKQFMAYKIKTENFPPFRTTFERKFLERLILQVQEPIVQRSREMREAFREDTLTFLANPQIFSEVCTVICDALYDYLYTEGYLDLPTSWRAHLGRA